MGFVCRSREGVRSLLSCLLMVSFLLIIRAAFIPQNAQGSLHWGEAKKEQIRVRLVALSWSHPRSSFFASEEIFVAEKELTPGESRLVKLVYGFLPYQPRLSESGFDYDIVHELRAVRDPSCDETLFQMTTDDQDGLPDDLKYSADAPVSDLERRHSPLPCYLTTADDYKKPLHSRATAN